MNVSLHIGRVAVSAELDALPEADLIRERFVWFVRDVQAGIVNYVGVCPEFALVNGGDALPSYQGLVERLCEGQVKLKFVPEAKVA